MRTLLTACGHALALVSVAALAHGDSGRVVLPTHLPPGSPRLTVVDATDVSGTRARAVAQGHRAAVDACVAAAQRADPTGLAAVQVAVAIVRLRADGRARAIEIQPSDLAQGLSVCLARALLQWEQPGPRGLRPAVRLWVNLAP